MRLLLAFLYLFFYKCFTTQIMPTFKALVLPHQKKQDGTYNVKIRVTQSGQTKYIKTGHHILSTDLIKKKENGTIRLKIKNQAIIDLTNEMIMDFKRMIISAGKDSDSWCIDRIIKYLTSTDNTFHLDFIAYGRTVVESIKKEGREGTSKQYNIAINALVRFIGKDSLDISHITSSFMTSFEKYIKTEPAFKGRRTGESIATDKAKGKRAVSLYPSRIKAIHNMAKLEYNDEDRGVIKIPFSPFVKYKIASIPKSMHRTLSIEQIQQIIDIPYNDTSKHRGKSLFNLAKDVFILSFSMMGMNSADFYDSSVLSGDIITYQRVKTKSRRDDMAEIKIRIEPEIKNLFQKYKDPTGEKIFNFHTRYKSSDIFNKMINKGLKSIGESIGVENLQYYYARHSMATLAANKAGVDMYTVDEMLNHSDNSLRLARVYIERDFSVLWAANRKVIDLFNWDNINDE